MPGYDVETRKLKVNTAQTVIALGPTVEAIAGNVQAGLGKLSEPEAGDSIAPALATMQSALEDAMPKLGMELRLLGGAVNSSAVMIETVEQTMQDRFHKFAI